LLCVLALVAAGCGVSGQQLDTRDAEAAIASKLAAETGASRVKAHCPTDVELKKGVTFDCEVTADGKKVTVRVRQLDDDGHVRWRVLG
jgi:Domain of unknown function (DUF4333)